MSIKDGVDERKLRRDMERDPDQTMQRGRREFAATVGHGVQRFSAVAVAYYSTAEQLHEERKIAEQCEYRPRSPQQRALATTAQILMSYAAQCTVEGGGSPEVFFEAAKVAMESAIESAAAKRAIAAEDVIKR